MLDKKVYAVDHGAVFDNSTDDSAAIQAAHDEIVASGEPGTLVLPARSRAKLLSPLEWDMAHVFIEGHGTVLDFSPITSGYSVKIGGSVNPPYKQAMQGASRVRFEGNARAGFVDAWRVEGVHPGTGAGPSHATFDRVSITNFGGGIRFYSHAYINSFFGLDIFNCGKDIYTLTGATGMGERLTFIACNFFNSDNVLVDDGASYVFQACSLDFCRKMMDLWDTKATLLGCHVESYPSSHTVAPFILRGSKPHVNVFGGWWVMRALPAGQSLTTPHIVQNLSTATRETGRMIFDGVRFASLQTSSGQFFTGTNILDFRNCTNENMSLRGMGVKDGMKAVSADADYNVAWYDERVIRFNASTYAAARKINLPTATNGAYHGLRKRITKEGARTTNVLNVRNAANTQTLRALGANESRWVDVEFDGVSGDWRNIGSGQF